MVNLVGWGRWDECLGKIDGNCVGVFFVGGVGMRVWSFLWFDWKVEMEIYLRGNFWRFCDGMRLW